MDFFTTDLDGVTLINPDEAERREILASVNTAEDADYPEVYLTSADEEVIGYRAGGILFQEEDGEVVRTIPEASLEMASQAWSWLACGNQESLDLLPWKYADD